MFQINHFIDTDGDEVVTVGLRIDRVLVAYADWPADKAATAHLVAEVILGKLIRHPEQTGVKSHALVFVKP